MRALWLYLRRQADLEPNRRKLWLPVFFALGIGIYFLLSAEPSKWLTLGIVELIIVSAVLLRFHPRILRVLMCLGIVAGGFAWAQMQSIYTATRLGAVPPDKLYIRGQIIKVDHSQKGKLRLTLDSLQDFERHELKGRFRVTLRQKKGEYQAGQCVELIAKLMPRAQTQIPNGYQFDRKNFYNLLSGSGYAESRALLTECPRADSSFTAKINNWRQKVITHIYRILPPEEASITAAIVAGEQGGISSAQVQNYRNSGLAHFLSISGLHMSMIAGLMFFFIRLLTAMIPPLALRVDSKKISAVAALALSAVYLLISGAAIPVQRAFIMTFIVLLGIFFNRRAISMYAIAWAAQIVLFFAPHALVGASFQMSFAAVVVLIAFYEKFSSRLSRWFSADKSSLLSVVGKGVIAYAVGLVLADFVASIATLPFAIYHFNRVAVYTSLTNLLAGPIIGFVVMPFTMLALLLMPMGLDAPALQVVGWGVGVLNDITGWVNSLEGASVPVLSMPLWGLILTVSGGLWLCIWERRWRLWGVPFIICGILSVFITCNPDILVNEEANVIAIKDNRGAMVILPSRGNQFTKQVWLDKTASKPLRKSHQALLQKIWQGQAQSYKWLDLSCKENICTYKKRVQIIKGQGLKLDGQLLSLKGTGGVAIYLSSKPQIVSVRQSIGNRLWNR